MKFKKTIIATYLLVFIVYAISPLVATLPQSNVLKSGLSIEDALAPRLMIFDMFAGGDDGQGPSLNASDSDDTDILLRKKRAILSTKNLLETITSVSLEIDRPQADHVVAYDAPKPSYYSAQQYFLSGVSPPFLT